jgi:putative phosphoesterase
MRIGVISDTHDYLDPRVGEIFDGVEHILHAGDIGRPWVVLDLEEIAPVTAVLGNNDHYSQFQETECVHVDRRKFLVHHILNPQMPPEALRRRIIRENPDVVVFGHTHQPFCEQIGGTLYLNPGYAGKQRFNLRRTVAILHCEDSEISAEFKPL